MADNILKYDVYAHCAKNLTKELIERHRSLGQSVQPSRVLPASDVRPIGILGAGPGGLYAALILEDLGIPYHIIEARDRVGGRLYTYEFPDKTGAPYNYYDVGAMRFPQIDAMGRVFKLFDYPPLNTGGALNLKQRLQKFYFSAKDLNNAFLSFNDVTIRRYADGTSTDHFKGHAVIKDVDPQPYLKAGVTAICNDVIQEFAVPLLDDLKNGTTTGWEKMKQADGYSTRAYMGLKYKPDPALGLPDQHLPTDVINWLETFDKSTGWYDRALTETVLESVAFGWQPGPNPPETDWWCIDGGTQQIARIMQDYIKTRKPAPNQPFTFNGRVKKIAMFQNEGINVTWTGASNTEVTRTFAQVISTIPLPVLRMIDLKEAGLSPMQSNALRELNYGPSIKIGMQFKTAWWSKWKNNNGEALNIVGGQTYTDRPLRTVVYPSFGDVVNGKTTTLIASYCWTEDASRMGALIVNGDTDQDQLLTELVLKELVDIHNIDYQTLKDDLIGYHGWNWGADPYTMGAFAFFGPGKFENLYDSLNSPAGAGSLHFAGEALSVRHAWVEGALDSAWRAICQILMITPGYEKYREKFVENWGMNPEWINPPEGKKGEGREGHRGGSDGKTASSIFDPEESLLFKHIATLDPNFEIRM